MSIYIIAIDTRHRQIFSIHDKRVGVASCGPDGMIDKKSWTFKHDDSVKVQQISNDVFATGGVTETEGKEIFKQLLKYSDKKPSEIIQAAKKIDRKLYPAFGSREYESLVLYGVYDNGHPFSGLAKTTIRIHSS